MRIYLEVTTCRYRFPNLFPNKFAELFNKVVHRCIAYYAQECTYIHMLINNRRAFPHSRRFFLIYLQIFNDAND